MKLILPLFLLAVFASCSTPKYLECPKYVGIAINTDSLPPCTNCMPNYKCIRIAADKFAGTTIDTTDKRGTVPEWMYTYTIRGKSFVIAHKALSVRAKGFCVQHLQCDGKPFKGPYKVGWCEGKELLLNRLVNEGRAK